MLIIESWQIPAFFFQPGIIGLAMIDIRLQDGTGCSFQSLWLIMISVVHQDRQVATGTTTPVCHHTDSFSLPSEKSLYHPSPRITPTGIQAWLYLWGHIIYLVLQTLVIACPARSKKFITHSSPLMLTLYNP